MTTSRPELLNSRRRRSARTLRESCQAAGLDDNGWRCFDCPLKALCESEARWLVPLSRPQLPI